MQTHIVQLKWIRLDISSWRPRLTFVQTAKSRHGTRCVTVDWWRRNQGDWFSEWVRRLHYGSGSVTLTGMCWLQLSLRPMSTAGSFRHDIGTKPFYINLQTLGSLVCSVSWYCTHTLQGVWCMMLLASFTGLTVYSVGIWHRPWRCSDCPFPLLSYERRCRFINQYLCSWGIYCTMLQLLTSLWIKLLWATYGLLLIVLFRLISSHFVFYLISCIYVWCGPCFHG